MLEIGVLCLLALAIGRLLQMALPHVGLKLDY